MRRHILLAALLLLFAAGAKAQVASIYVTSSSRRFANVSTGAVTTGSGFQERYASLWASGVGGGVTLNFLPIGPVGLGLDFRGSTQPPSERTLPWPGSGWGVIRR